MKQLKIIGGEKLTGSINISGAKNSAVALVPAALLSDEEVIIDNIPNISDIESLKEIMKYLGAEITIKEQQMKIKTDNMSNRKISLELSQKLRASYYFMGALLGKYKKVEMYFPGGCSIGKRPINLHLKGFKALGAKVKEVDNYYCIEATELKGNHIYLDIASVGATINIILAAVKAQGKTIIENAAKEPEIVNVVTFLNNMGAKITGAGTGKIEIIGVSKLKSAYTEVIPDRIEAGTYTILGALIGDNLKINNIIPEHIESLIMKLKEMNANIEVNQDNVIITQSDISSVNIKTVCYPGFPTDLQQPMTTLLTQAKGISKLEENIYENRFLNVKYLNDMGADISINGKVLKIKGPTKLHGTTVFATDLRAGACLILAALIADGTTTIKDVEHVLRGYGDIVEKLSSVGAKISLEEI